MIAAVALLAVRTATVYSDSFEGKLTADGSKFSQSAMTCAETLLFNQYKTGYGKTRNRVYLTLTYKEKSIDVELTDKMAPRFNGKRIDLSKAASLALFGDDWVKIEGVEVTKK